MATQELRQAREEGKDVAIRLRAMMKYLLGTRNEGLVEFNIRPRRPYGPRKKGSPRKQDG